MAIFGRDFYGRSKYGGRQRFEMVVDPFVAETHGFDTVALTWNEPAGTWSGFRLLRSRHGYPVTETDGEILLDFPVGYSGATGGEFVDSNLLGGWHYYAIFLWDSGASVWERSGTVDVLVPFDYESTEKFWDAVPTYYRQVVDDGAGFNQQKYRINPAIYLNNEQMVPNLLLAKYLGVFGWGMDLLRTQADQVLDGYDIETVHVNRLALLAAQFGAEIEAAAPASANRSLVRNLGWLYRKRGTLEGIRELLALMTGWDLDVSTGPNLMLNEDQSNFIHPQPDFWDPSVRYEAGDRVRHLRFLFQAKQTAYGPSQAPPTTRTSDAYWDGDRFIEPDEDRQVSRLDTGDINTWQVEGPTGFIDSGTFIGAGSIDPEDGTLYNQNSLAFRNNGAAPGDFTVRSIPRRKTNLTSWDKQLVIESGIPKPEPRKQWQAGTRYRAGDMVMFEGAPYEALGTTESDPTVTTAWKRLGYDDRVRLNLSFWAHGPFNGTVNTGGLKTHAHIIEFDQNGDFIYEVTAAPSTYANVYFDPFNVAGALAAGRAPAKGAAWGSGGLGSSWVQKRDANGGYVYPQGTGRAYQLAPDLLADGNVGVTFRTIPSGGRLIGLIFRWVDASNFWIATQTGVYKVVAGAARANPASGALTYTAFTAGQRMRVNLAGNVITVYKDGAQVGTATDSFNATATRHGVEVEA